MLRKLYRVTQQKVKNWCKLDEPKYRWFSTVMLAFLMGYSWTMLTLIAVTATKWRAFLAMPIGVPVALLITLTFHEMWKLAQEESEEANVSAL